MQVFSDINNIRMQRYADLSSTWGLVPTMGYLHTGHLNLVHRARVENDKVGVSIFVNPTQFNNIDDLTTYPHDLEHDLELLEKEGVDLVWTPSTDIVYPPDFQTNVELVKITKLLEGAVRPGHFKGVTTVVTKLFNIFQPDRAYFGKKDYQQLVVIKQLTKDLNFNIAIIPCDTVREKDGLAMSSRNSNLSKSARKHAVCLYNSLQAAKNAVDAGEYDCKNIYNNMENIIKAIDVAKIDYISIADPETLEELNTIKNKALISLVIYIDNVRLIDNMEVKI